MPSLEMWILVTGGRIPRSHCISRRNYRWPCQSERCRRLASPNHSNPSSRFSRIGGILPQVRRRILEHSPTNDPIVEEGQEVWMDRQMWSDFSRTQEEIDFSPNLDHAGYHEALRCVLWRIQDWSRMCANARRQSYILSISTTEATWAKLPNPWPRTRSRSSSPEDMEALPHGKPLRDLFGSQDSEVYIHSEGAEYEIEKMDWANQGLRPGHSLSPR